MQDIEDVSPLKSNRAKMSNWRMHQKSSNKKDSQAEVKNMFKTLNTWRDESQEQFSKIVYTYNTSIIKGFNDLSEEVYDLQAQLYITTQERIDLTETVNNLKGEIRELNEKLISVQHFPRDEEYDSQHTQLVGSPEIWSPNTKEQYVESPKISSGSDDECTNLEQLLGYIPTETLEQQKRYPSNNLSSLNDLTPKEMADKYLNDTENEIEVEDKVDESDEEQEETEGRSKEKGNMMFSSLTKLKISKNMPPEDLICPECNFEFSARENVLVHLKNVHSKFDQREVNLDENEVSIAQNDHSGRSEYVELEDVKMTKVHYESNNQEGDAWKRKLKHHKESVQRSGNKKYKCEQCHYSSTKRGVIKNHVKEVHDKIKDHVCEECGYAASRRRSLMRHWEAVHKLGDKKFKCEKCSYSSAEKKKLEYHYISAHNMGEKFRCEKCPYSTARRDTLKEHTKEVHDKIRSHVCGECEYAAKRNKTLKNHIQSIHKIGAKRFKCVLCHYKSNRRQDLSKHVENVHWQNK